MLLNMATEGRCLSKTYQTLKMQGFIDRNRLSAEEITWTDTKLQDGNALQPDRLRVYPAFPGARYVDNVMVEVRDSIPGDHTGWDNK